MTEHQIARATKDWSALAGEALELERIGDTLYAFGSELACLRLHYKMQIGRVAFSENLQRWAYSKTLRFL